ncbi:hypothetical protein GCM10010207_73290 [Streptomyces atratus]|nr:hypothetical protein GCM10010207_73290 [Streptomyces atratus]
MTAFRSRPVTKGLYVLGPPVLGFHRRLRGTRIVPGQRDRHWREDLHVPLDGQDHTLGQRHVSHLAALGKREAQLRPHHLHLAPDMDDFLGKVEVIGTQSQRLSLPEAQARSDLDEDSVPVRHCRTYGQHTLGSPRLNSAGCRGRRTDGA